MIITKQRVVWISVLGGIAGLLIGCELVVDFDRSKIPVEGTDAGQVDGSTTFDATFPEGGNTTDGSTSDASDASTVDATDSATTDAGDASDGSITDAQDDAPDGDM